MKTPPPSDNFNAARSAGLRYVNPHDPGLRRKRRGRDFVFLTPAGRVVRDAATLARIKRLAIPPAWTDVWICPHANGHIQATGRDDRGRKQYRYHEDWRAVRDENKFERMIVFGRALPRIRARIARDLRRPGLGREKVLATIVRLLETTLVRVGNDEYARQNHSFGLSTMRDEHAKIRGGTVRFEFKGKSGRRHRIELHEPRVAKIVRQAQELPGQELFQYIDPDGTQHDVKSDDVNAYLREIAGEEFSAKDFRTWAGTVLAAIALHEFERFDTKAQAKKNLVRAIEHVAERLGNTPAVCRKCYIHPVILQSYLDGTTIAALRNRAEDELNRTLPKLSGAEGAVLAFLEAQLRRPKPTLLASLKKSVARTRRRRWATQAAFRRPARTARRPRESGADGRFASRRSRARRSRGAASAPPAA